VFYSLPRKLSFLDGQTISKERKTKFFQKNYLLGGVTKTLFLRKRLFFFSKKRGFGAERTPKIEKSMETLSIASSIQYLEKKGLPFSICFLVTERSDRFSEISKQWSPSVRKKKITLDKKCILFLSKMFSKKFIFMGSSPKKTNFVYLRHVKKKMNFFYLNYKKKI
jgi:hypothetical protein